MGGGMHLSLGGCTLGRASAEAASKDGRELKVGISLGWSRTGRRSRPCRAYGNKLPCHRCSDKALKRRKPHRSIIYHPERGDPRRISSPKSRARVQGKVTMRVFPQDQALEDGCAGRSPDRLPTCITCAAPRCLIFKTVSTSNNLRSIRRPGIGGAHALSRVAAQGISSDNKGDGFPLYGDMCSTPESVVPRPTVKGVKFTLLIPQQREHKRGGRATPADDCTASQPGPLGCEE